jgi:glutamate-ammonia-ligase adenylyltransferase
MGSVPAIPLAIEPVVTPRMGYAAADHSRFVQRIRRRYAKELALLPPGLPRRDVVSALVAQLQQGGRALPSALRVARQLVLERLAVLDVEQNADVQDITLAMTELAEATLEIALERTLADQDERFGVPRDGNGERIDFWIVGMGKLGARELNVSSDIDLVYVYEGDGQTDGAPTLPTVAAPHGGVAGLGSGPAPGQARSVSAHEYFSQVARGLYSLIGKNDYRTVSVLDANGQPKGDMAEFPMP